MKKSLFLLLAILSVVLFACSSRTDYEIDEDTVFVYINVDSSLVYSEFDENGKRIIPTAYKSTNSNFYNMKVVAFGYVYFDSKEGNEFIKASKNMVPIYSRTLSVNTNLFAVRVSDLDAVSFSINEINN